jgi:hypothetical protein
MRKIDTPEIRALVIFAQIQKLSDAEALDYLETWASIATPLRTMSVITFQILIMFI